MTIAMYIVGYFIVGVIAAIAVPRLLDDREDRSLPLAAFFLWPVFLLTLVLIAPIALSEIIYEFNKKN